MSKKAEKMAAAALSLILKSPNGGGSGITTDATPTEGSTNPVQSGGVYTALLGKADVDGSYAGLTAGNADVALVAKNIAPISEESGTIQSNPFISQGTGTANNTSSVDTSPVAKQLEKQGYTVANNQFLNTNYTTAGFTASGTHITLDKDDSPASLNRTIQTLSTPIPAGHKVLFYGYKKSGAFTGNAALGGYHVETGNNTFIGYINLATLQNGYFAQLAYDDTRTLTDMWAFFYAGYTCTESLDMTLYAVDLTQYFNGNSNIPADLLSNPSHWPWYDNGTGSYDTGTLKNANGRYLVCTGRNIYKSGEAYTIVVPNRAYNYKGGSATTITYYDKGKNSIGTESVSSGSQFTTPANCVYIASSVTSGVTISLYYSPEQGGEGYDVDYPYAEPNVYDTGTEELLSAGSAKDTKTPDGTVTHNVGTLAGQTGAIGDTITLTGAKSDTANVICSLGVLSEWGTISGTIVTLTKALSNETIYFELATPTTEQGTSFPENIEVDDYGMMYWLDTDGNLVSIPQGVKLFYPADYVLFTDTAVSYTDGDVTKIALKGELASGDPETIKGVVDYINARIPAPPAEDGAYTLTVTVAGGTATYSWESTT